MTFEELKELLKNPWWDGSQTRYINGISTYAITVGGWVVEIFVERSDVQWIKAWKEYSRDTTVYQLDFTYDEKQEIHTIMINKFIELWMEGV